MLRDGCGGCTLKAMSRVKEGMFSVRLVLAGALAAGLFAQIQFPGSGGPFPGGGGGPIGGGGGRRGRNTDPAPSKGRKDKANTPVVTTTTGMLRAVAGNQFVIEGDDHRIITYKVGDKMTVTRDGKPVELSSFAIADHISVDSTADDMGFFTATGVTFNMPGTAHDRDLASRTWDLPNLGGASVKPAAAKHGDDDDDRPTLRRSKDDDAGAPQQKASATPAPAPVEPEPEALPTTLIRPSDPPPDADDPGRPQVKRGKPAPRVSASNTEPEPVSGPAPVSTARAAVAPAEPIQAIVPIEEDPIIVKARAAAAEYAGSLPNFFCRQLTTRYDSDRPKDGWQAHDTIAADLAYENGHENYTNIKVGSKTVKTMEEVGGNWSTGEFASMLDEVFDPDSATTFRKTGQDTINGRSATTFKFEISRERSGWRISDGGQLYYPAMRGTIWIDKETSRVLRLEKETRNMPLLFPLVKVEVAVDYDFVRLSTPEPFLLPITSEVLSCEQGSTHCVRNKIEFRNYRKFGAESGITFDEKQ
jgi:hypothetical protein